MRRYGNAIGVLLIGLALMLGVALLLRQAWNWSIPGVFGFGPIAFRHVLGLILLGAVSVGLLRFGRQRFTGRW